MTRALASMLILGFGIGCSFEEEAPQLAAPATVSPSEALSELTITIPKSEHDMLLQEVTALKAQALELNQKLADKSKPVARKTVYQSREVNRKLVAAEAELQRLQAELAEAQSQLALSQEENTELRASLEDTRAALVETAGQLTETKDSLSTALRNAADAGWSDIVSQSQVALCPKGSRKKMAQCHENAAASVAHIEAAARECLHAGHATPQVAPHVRGESMPRQAVWIGKTHTDWYVVLCDPKLPEAEALLADVEQPREDAPSPTRFEDDAKEPASTASRYTTASYSAPLFVTQDEPDYPDVDLDPDADDAADEPGDAEDDDALSSDLAALVAELEGDDDSRDQRRSDKKKRKKEEAPTTSRRSLSLDNAGLDLLDE